MRWSKLVPELTVYNFQSALEFYTQVLGFRIVHQRVNPNFAYLAHSEQDEIQLMLEEYHENIWQSGELVAPLGRGINFQIELADIEPVYTRLQSAHYPLFRDITEAWRDVGSMLIGEREFLIQDLDGYLLRFSQPIGERAKPAAW